MEYIERFENDPITALLHDAGNWEFCGSIFRDILSDGVRQVFEYGWEDGTATLSHLVNQNNGGESGTGGIDLEFSSVKAKEWANDYSGNMITRINESTRDMIRRDIEAAVKAEDTWGELKDRLKDAYGFSDRRAETIARTETGMAYNIGAVDAWKASGLVEKVLVVDGDDYDDACKEANGQEWTFDEAIFNPLEHPNCVREFFPILNGAGEGDNDEGEDE